MILSDQGGRGWTEQSEGSPGHLASANRGFTTLTLVPTLAITHNLS